MNRDIDPKLLQRFWSKVIKTDSCWNWSANKSKRGYGYFWHHRTNVLAHRFSYELFNDQIPSNLELDHLCRNHSCVNPEHLEPVSHKENMYRGKTITSTNRNKTHCKNGHVLKNDNLVKYSLNCGSRRCRICNNEYFKNRRLKVKLGVIEK